MTTICTKNFDIRQTGQGDIIIVDWRTNKSKEAFLQGDDAHNLLEQVTAADNPEGRIVDANKRMAAVDSLCAEYFD